MVRYTFDHDKVLVDLGQLLQDCSLAVFSLLASPEDNRPESLIVVSGPTMLHPVSLLVYYT